MNIVTIIPAKGNSNRLKDKNIYELNGKPLLQWTLEAAKKSKYLDRIFVSTESSKVADITNKNGGIVIDRPKELTHDNIGKQEVIEHALSVIEDYDNEKVDVICLLQANSPQIKTEKIDEAIETILSGVVWDVISINKDTLFTDGAIRVFKRRVVDDCGVGMYKGIVLTDYVDVHYKQDVEEIEKVMRDESNNI